MTKEQNYQQILKNADSLFAGITNKITILANASALLYNNLENLNWAGFYHFLNNQLELGPFQGKIACMIIPLNKGVCGACATAKETIVVDNVHNFSGHIACDSASNSEIVIPVFNKDNTLYALLDIDSPIYSRFDEIDKFYLEEFVKILQKHL